MSGLAAASRVRMTVLAESLLALVPVGNRLRHPLSRYPDDKIDHLLSSAGMARQDLFTACRGNASHRRRMAKMMEHFDAAPDFAVRHFWGALRRADKVCVECANKRRCISWLDWRTSADAPCIFCPNAGTFGAVAFARRQTEQA